MDKVQAVLETMLTRRSIRRYTDQPVAKEQIEKLLDAAMAAPSGNAVRPWHFVVVQEAERRRRLSKVHRWASMCAQAPLVVAVCAQADDMTFWIDDSSAATENLLLMAQAMGLGGVWIGIRQTPAHERSVREIVGAPESVRVLCLLAIGYPAEQRPAYSGHNRTQAHWEQW
jgi:nitroreductase